MKKDKKSPRSPQCKWLSPYSYGENNVMKQKFIWYMDRRTKECMENSIRFTFETLKACH